MRIVKAVYLLGIVALLAGCASQPKKTAAKSDESTPQTIQVSTPPAGETWQERLNREAEAKQKKEDAEKAMNDARAADESKRAPVRDQVTDEKQRRHDEETAMINRAYKQQQYNENLKKEPGRDTGHMPNSTPFSQRGTPPSGYVQGR